VTQLSGAMNISLQDSPVVESTPIVAGQSRWFAVHTWPKYEKKICATLGKEGVEAFLPLATQVHRWSDRRMKITVPLFSCYMFVRIIPLPANRIQVLRASGVMAFVGTRGQGTPIPDCQIEDLRALLSHGVGVDPYPFLTVGRKVRIRGGCLEGVEGILVAKDGDQKLVVSVDAIQRSVAVSLRGYDVEPA